MREKLFTIRYSFLFNENVQKLIVNSEQRQTSITIYLFPIMSNKKNIKIAPMSLADVAAVKELEKKSHLSDWSVEAYCQEVGRQDSISLVAKKDKTIVGFMIARLITNKQHDENRQCDEKSKDEKAEVEIYNLAVANEMRREGIGRKLFERCLELSKNDGKVRVWLEVRESNVGAIGFYRNCGFEIAYKRKNFYRNPPEAAFVLRLETN